MKIHFKNLPSPEVVNEMLINTFNGAEGKVLWSRLSEAVEPESPFWWMNLFEFARNNIYVCFEKTGNIIKRIDYYKFLGFAKKKSGRPLMTNYFFNKILMIDCIIKYFPDEFKYYYGEELHCNNLSEAIKNKDNWSEYKIVKKRAFINAIINGPVFALDNVYYKWIVDYIGKSKLTDNDKNNYKLELLDIQNTFFKNFDLRQYYQAIDNLRVKITSKELRKHTIKGIHDYEVFPTVKTDKVEKIHQAIDDCIKTTPVNFLSALTAKSKTPEALSWIINYRKNNRKDIAKDACPLTGKKKMLTSFNQNRYIAKNIFEDIPPTDRHGYKLYRFVESQKEYIHDKIQEKMNINN